MSGQSQPQAVDAAFIVRVSEDELSAHVEKITLPQHGGRPFIAERLLEALQQKDVIHGIDEEKITQLVKRLNQGELPESDDDYVIARGQAAEDGADGHLQWHVDEARLRLGAFYVRNHQPIVSYIPATEGKNGTDLFGRPLTAKPGSNHYPRIGGELETVTTEFGEQYRSRSMGLVQYNPDPNNWALQIEPRFSVSEDEMEARMDIYAVSGDGEQITMDAVLEMLAEWRVVHGIDHEIITKALARSERLSTQEHCEGVADVLVACGTPPQEGKDAKLVISRDENSVGRTDAKGRIDFHERDYPWNVHKDETIGYLLEAKPAVDGVPVYGGVINARQPLEIEVTLLNLHKDEKGKLIADMDGALLIDGHVLSVVELLSVEGDIDNRTGNVRSKIPVHVKGHVEPGFIVESAKEIIIDKNIEDAKVVAGAGIIIKGGIRGTHSELFAPGNVDVGFVENAKLFVNGNLHVTGSVINSELATNGEIVIGDKNAKKSAVMGGEITAKTKISAATLGTHSYAKTVVRVGLGQEARREINQLENTIRDKDKEIYSLNQIEQRYRLHPKPDSGEILRKVAATRKAVEADIEALKQQQEEIREQLLSSNTGCIEVLQRVYPGVIIHIAHHTLEIKNELGAGTFTFERESNSIIFHPAN